MLTLVRPILRELIAIVKSSLKKVLGKAYLTYLILYTTLTEIENIMNSHPLTYLNEDQFLESFTPNLRFMVIRCIVDAKVAISKMWIQVGN